MKRIVISGGGTAGHINPALSIAEALLEQGWKIDYIGNKNSLEKVLVKKAGYTFHEINIQKLYRKFTLAHLKFPVKLLISTLQTIYLFKRLKPQVYLGSGGFVSGPAGLAAHLMHIPIVLQEQNSYPGLTTRVMARWSQMVFLGNKQAKKYLKTKQIIYTGNPINKKISQTNSEFHPDTLGLKSHTDKVFLLGGSQGSLVLNNSFAPIISELIASGYEIIWQTGASSYQRFKRKYAHIKGVYLFDYSYEISDLYKLSSLVISRAGALTLAELDTVKKPALLVPLPTAAENHQLHNAQEFVHAGKGEIIEQKNLTPDELLKKVIAMMKNKKKYQSRFGSSLHEDAAQSIASLIDKNWGGNSKCLEK